VVDGGQDAVAVFHDFDIPEAQDVIAARLEKAGAVVVMADGFIRAVLAAVEFDNQFGGRAEEIDDVGTDGVLAAEAQIAKLARAQRGPENAFGVGGGGAQGSGEVALEVAAAGEVGFGLWQWTPPRTRFARSTLPQGEGKNQSLNSTR
jgi:hypothetical protein